MAPTIYVSGEDRTAQIRDWKIISKGQGNGFSLSCTFHSGKSYPFPLANCEVAPYRELRDVLMERVGRSQVQAVRSVKVYGERYAIVQFEGNAQEYAFKLEDIQLSPKVDQQAKERLQNLGALGRCATVTA